MKKNILTLILIVALIGSFTLASCKEKPIDPTPIGDESSYLVKEAAEKNGSFFS